MLIFSCTGKQFLANSIKGFKKYFFASIDFVIVISRSQHHLLPLQNVAELHRAVLIIRKLFLMGTSFFPSFNRLAVSFFLPFLCLRLTSLSLSWTMCANSHVHCPSLRLSVVLVGKMLAARVACRLCASPPCFSSFDQSEGCYTWLQIWGIVVRWVTPRHRTVPCLLFCLLPAYLPACLLFRFGSCVQRVNL